MSSVLHTPERSALVERVAALGEKIAARADRIDAEAVFPYENWADLAEAGLLGIVVPTEAGGLGGDFVGYALASEELARHCGSTALTFNMHVATTLLVGEIAERLEPEAADRAFLARRRTTLYRGVIDEHHIHSQPFSEGLSPGATTGYATRAEPVDGGYLVTGRKIFASLAGAADFHNVLCQVEGDDRLRLLGVPHASDGLQIQGEWNPLGMRGTDSRTLLMERVFVPAEHEWLPPGLFNQAADRFPYFFLTLSFSYLGIMRAVIDVTEAHLRAGGRSNHVVKQQGWTAMNLRYEQAQALCYRVLGDVRVDPDPDLVRRAQASLVTTMEGAPEIAMAAIQICGGRSLLKPSTIERLYRDARCGAVMLPWSVEVCREHLGRSGLDDDERVDQ